MINYFVKLFHSFDIITYKSFSKETYGDLDIKNIKGSIEFKNLKFKYGSNNLFENLNFKITCLWCINKNINIDRVRKTNSIDGFFAKRWSANTPAQLTAFKQCPCWLRFCKKSYGILSFRTSIFFYVFMNTRYISVMQITIYISNSSCAAFIAFTISSWFTSTVTRISDVEIIRIFTSALYKALNIRAAIP